MLSVVTFIAVGSAKTSTGGLSFWPALVGAVVGGAVSLATTLLVETRRTRAADKERKRQMHADARLAGRIIGLELSEVESVLRIAIQQVPFVWPPASGYRLPDKAWSEYSGDLGGVVPLSLWDEIALPYSSFKYANLLGPLNLSTARTMLDQTKAAVAALESWSAGSDDD